jgi:hypothetical protein
MYGLFFNEVSLEGISISPGCTLVWSPGFAALDATGAKLVPRSHGLASCNRFSDTCQEMLFPRWKKGIKITRLRKTSRRNVTSPITSNDKILAFGEWADMLRNLFDSLAGEPARYISRCHVWIFQFSRESCARHRMDVQYCILNKHVKDLHRNP